MPIKFYTLSLTVERLLELRLKSRTLRLFVSSSFLDFQEERKLLHEKVFPKLRKECELRGLILTDVDLRWGLQAHVAGTDVVSTCLDEVAKCSPYFISFIGNRYGWSPSEEDKALCDDRFRWIDKFPDHSITHLEIIMGIFNVAEEKRRALVYDRTSDDCLSERVQMESSQPEKLHAVKALKKKLEATPGITYRKYFNPKEIFGQILQDLMGILNTDFPAKVFSNLFEEEAYAHRAFAISRVSSFVEVPMYTSLVSQVVESSHKHPTMILSQSGVGKSSFLSYLSLRYLEQNKQAKVFFHFVGQTSQSSHYTNILRRLLCQLSSWCPTISEEVPNDIKKMTESLPNWLASLASYLGDEHAYIVIDALNQLEDVDLAKDLKWLPNVWPSNVHVIVSSTEPLSWTDLTIDFPVMNEESRMKLSNSYLSKYGKSFETKHLEMIKNASHISTPMHLILILDELRVSGTFAQLEDQIAKLLSAKNVYEVAALMFNRWETSYAALAKPKQWTFQPNLGPMASSHSTIVSPKWNLIEATLGFIRCSYRGLRENELFDVLGVQRSQIVHFFYTLEEIVQSHSGLIIFSHSSLEQTVDGEYLSRVDIRQVHACLAAYFETLPNNNPRKLEEYPYHLLQLDAKDKLRNFLSDYQVFTKLVASDFSRIELAMYWRALGTDQACDRYKKMLERRLYYHSERAKCGDLGEEDTEGEGEGEGEEKNDAKGKIVTMGNVVGAGKGKLVENAPIKIRAYAVHDIKCVAHCLHAWGEFDEAENMFAWALFVCFKGLATLIMAKTYSCFHLVGKVEKWIPTMLPLVRLDTCKKLHEFSKGSLATTHLIDIDFENMLINTELGDILSEDDTALHMFITAQVMESLARLFSHGQNTRISQALYEQALKIFTHLFGKNDFRSSTIMGDMAWLCIKSRKYKGANGAMSLLKRAIFAKSSLFLTKCDVGEIVVSNGNEMDSGWIKFIEKLTEIALMGSATAIVDSHVPPLINRMAVALSNMKQFRIALLMYSCSLALNEAFNGPFHPNLATVCGDVSSFYMNLYPRPSKGEKMIIASIESYVDPFSEVLRLELEQERESGHEARTGDRSSREGSSAPEMSRTSSAVAQVSKQMNTELDIEHLSANDCVIESLAWVDRGIDIRRKTLGVKHPFLATLYMNKGDVLVKTKRWKEAGIYYQKGTSIRLSVFGEKSPQVRTVQRKLETFQTRINPVSK
eukprot:m.21653 g.21653  ORF g.21653 m.21653 type:complete len:1211 (+) comp5374_c0_seq1:126-3758(+)